MTHSATNATDAADRAPAGSSDVPPYALRTVGLGRRLPSGDRELEILADVDLEIAAGASVAVIGPSGSGKSTLLGLLAGLDRPSEGHVELLGRRLDRLDEDALARLRRAHVGFVFQSFRLLGSFTARENVAVPLELLGRRDALERADALLAEVGLAERRHHRPAQLSGGEQQRVAVARAFASGPDVLLADEPTGNLDDRAGGVVLDMLDALRREHGTTVMLVTHDPAVAARADRRVTLHDGRVVEDALVNGSAT